MAGFAKDGNLYPTSGVYGINDDVVSSDTGWSSQKVMNKLANVKSIIRVDGKPTIADGTVTYIKDGTSYTTTDQETWFYYMVDSELYRTIFIEGVEYTKADSSIDFDDFVAKTDIVTALNNAVTDKQVPSAKAVYNATNNKNLKTYTSLSQLGLTVPCTVSDIYLALSSQSMAIISCDDAKNSVKDVPEDFGLLNITKNSISRFSISYKISAQSNVAANRMYIGQLKGTDGTGLIWKRVDTDEWKTGIEVANTTTYSDDVLKFPVGKYYIYHSNASLFSNLPESTGGILEVLSTTPNYDLDKHAWCFRTYRFTTYLGKIYTRGLYTAETAGTFTNDTGWKRVDTNIVTTLNSSCTDVQVPSAKTVYNLSNELTNYKKNTSDYINLSSLCVAFGLEEKQYTIEELYLALPLNINVSFNQYASNTVAVTDFPSNYGVVEIVKTADASRNIVRFTSMTNGALYLWHYHASEASAKTWRRVCTTKVNDVGRTNITFDSGITGYLLKNTVADTNYYYVKDGICYASIYFECVSTGTMAYVPVARQQLPKAKDRQWFSCGVWNNTVVGGNSATITIAQNGSLLLTGGTAGAQYLLSFSYPVAE